MRDTEKLASAIEGISSLANAILASGIFFVGFAWLAWGLMQVQ